MFKIVVVTDLERLSGEARSIAYETLDRLSYEGKALVRRVPSSATEITADIFEDCSAVIIRPTDPLKIQIKHFKKAREKVHIFTVSEGVSHVESFKKETTRFRIVKVSPEFSNDRGVAAYNLTLAHALFSRLPINLNNIDLKNFKCTTDQTNLVGKNWLVLGAGKQVARLLHLGHRSGIRKFFIWKDNMDRKAFEKCFEFIRPSVRGILQMDKKKLKATLFLDGRRSTASKAQIVEFYGSSKHKRFCSQADVVSVHMKHQKKADKRHDSNTKFIDRNFIRSLSRRPILLNMARGELINENDVLSALKNGELKGAAVDVLHGNVERYSAHYQSKLWAARLTQLELQKNGRLPKRKRLNLIITPHIAGSADNDVGPMWKFILNELKDAIQFPQA